MSTVPYLCIRRTVRFRPCVMRLRIKFLLGRLWQLKPNGTLHVVMERSFLTRVIFTYAVPYCITVHCCRFEYSFTLFPSHQQDPWLQHSNQHGRQLIIDLGRSGYPNFHDGNDIYFVHHALACDGVTEINDDYCDKATN